VVPEPGVYYCVSFFLILIFIIPVLVTSSSLVSYPYSYPLHFPSFSCATIHCSPSNYSFCSSSTLSPIFTSPFYPSPTCHHTAPPSYTLTDCWLVYCTNCTQLQPLAIPETRFPPLQQKYAQTHTRASSPSHFFPHPHTPFLTPSPFSYHLLPIPQNL
jgi:hypothetical protein